MKKIVLILAIVLFLFWWIWAYWYYQYLPYQINKELVKSQQNLIEEIEKIYKTDSKNNSFTTNTNLKWNFLENNLSINSNFKIDYLISWKNSQIKFDSKWNSSWEYTWKKLNIDYNLKFDSILDENNIYFKIEDLNLNFDDDTKKSLWITNSARSESFEKTLQSVFNSLKTKEYLTYEVSKVAKIGLLNSASWIINKDNIDFQKYKNILKSPIFTYKNKENNNFNFEVNDNFCILSKEVNKNFGWKTEYKCDLTELNKAKYYINYDIFWEKKFYIDYTSGTWNILYVYDIDKSKFEKFQMDFNENNEKSNLLINWDSMNLKYSWKKWTFDIDTKYTFTNQANLIKIPEETKPFEEFIMKNIFLMSSLSSFSNLSSSNMKSSNTSKLSKRNPFKNKTSINKLNQSQITNSDPVINWVIIKPDSQINTSSWYITSKEERLRILREKIRQKNMQNQ